MKRRRKKWKWFRSKLWSATKCLTIAEAYIAQASDKDIRDACDGVLDEYTPEQVAKDLCKIRQLNKETENEI